MAICYYISSHGLGHAIRSSAIINEIDPSIPVILRTAVNPSLLAEEIRRPVRFESASFDCGGVQKDGFTVDGPATLAEYGRVHEANLSRLAEEQAFLRNHGVQAVVSDVASFPLRVAHALGIPSIVIGNFSWEDIYTPLVAEIASHRALLTEIAGEYRLATRSLRLPLSRGLARWENAVDVPLVCRQGLRMRPAMAGWLDIDPEARWVLLYLGQYPTDFNWSRLERTGSHVFLTVSRDPISHPGVVRADPGRFDAADILASCDVVVGKAGYGTVADCMAADVPLVYARTTGFAEADALDAELAEWGRGVKIDRETLFHGDLAPAIEKALVSSVRRMHSTNGANECARHIVDLWQRSRNGGGS